MQTANKITLPGVGAFDAGISASRELGLEIATRHAMTENGTRILEHRLFFFISLNWRGRPLVNYETGDSIATGIT